MREYEYRGRRVEMEVINKKENFIHGRVTDEDFLSERVESAKKTFVDNGYDRENLLEVSPFVKFEDGEIVANPNVYFFSEEKFEEQTYNSE